MTAVSHRGRLTYPLVIETARAHVIESGVRDLSLRRIAAELGVTAPALYAYVDGKRGLVAGVAERELVGLLERFGNVGGRDPLTRIRRLCKAYIEYALENPRLFDVIFSSPPELSIVGPSGAETEIATRAFTYGTDDVNAAIGRGLFRDDVTAEVITFTIWTTTHGLASVLLLGFEADRRARDRLIDSIIDTLFRGLAPRP